jgi:transposase
MKKIHRLIESIVDSNPSITLKDIKRILIDENNVEPSKSTIDRILKTIGVTLKSSYKLLDRVNYQQTIELRSIYSNYFLDNKPRDNKKIIFLDESGFDLHLRRNKARSKRGQRASVIVPTVRGRNVTLILAANRARVIHHKIISNTTCNGEKFMEFMRRLLGIIRLDEKLHGSWIVMDNSRIHKVEGVREICDQYGCKLLFLSPYSFMLNPVANIFSKMKSYVRNQLSAPKENENLEETIKNGIRCITSDDLRDYFDNIEMIAYKTAFGIPYTVREKRIGHPQF